MFDMTKKQKTNLSLAVTFAVLLGACTSKAIKMESSELALDVPSTEQVVAGESSQDFQASNDDSSYEAPAITKSSGKSAHKKAKRKGLKSKQIAKSSKKSSKSLVSAAATVAKEVEAPKMFDQETSKYPSNDTLNNIVIPAPMQEAAMMDDGSEASRGFWMAVLAGLLVVLGAGGYVYKTRFSKTGKRRKLVYNG